MRKSLIRHFLLCIGFTMLLIGVSAQEYNFNRFSIEEGLPRSGVYDIYEDKNGYLWIGTEEGGVSVFDGSSFHIFTTEDGLVSNTVRCIYEDSKGIFWFGTDKGLSSYNGDVFITYTLDNQSLPEIRSIQQDKSGVLCLGTLGQGVFRVKGIESSELKVQKITTEEGLLDNKVRVIFLDSKGVLWVGTDGGLNKIKGNLITGITTENGLSDNRVLSIFEDKSKTLWFGTQNGASHLVAGEFNNYTEKDGLISNRVKAISQDYMGYIWFGTKKRVTCFDGKFFSHITEKNG